MKILKLAAGILIIILSVSCSLPSASETPLSVPPTGTVDIVATPSPILPTLTLNAPPPDLETPPATVIPTPSLNAKLTEFQGGVQAKLPEGLDFLDAAMGMILPVQSQVRTLTDGRARLDLSSGTIIRITPDSLFTLTFENPDPANPVMRIKLAVGQLFIILRGGSVDVETPSGVASVRGSYMSVNIDPETGDALIECLEGDCQLDTPAGSFHLSTGRKARLRFSPDGSAPLMPAFDIMTETDIQNWLLLNPEVIEVQIIVEGTVESIPPREESTRTKAPKGHGPGPGDEPTSEPGPPPVPTGGG